MLAKVRVFRYIEALDAFLVTDEYQALADRLGLNEWNPVVWIGRLFTLDNDYGEHWFDNWEERKALEAKAAALGLESHNLLIVVPGRFTDGKDGPCHPPEMRKRFWTDVLQSLELSCELLFAEARRANEALKEAVPEEYLPDLEERIREIQRQIAVEPAG